MKLLSPAGNLDALKVAVYHGADEVYLGINEFNARNNIDGFTLDNLGTAVDFCHLYGVKVCLAINILFSTNELPLALDVVVKSYNLGVDYFIVQDLGLAYLISKTLPSAVLHASTQMGIHNLEGVLAILPYGFKRVVLARETPISEIKRIKQNTNIEIEYFAHGALCVGFSGNCYLSSYMLNASGNRGKCKQLCRLPYSLYFKDKKLKSGYLLSAKDFDTSERLKELKDAGVDVLKIEGRARRPFYVGAITREYRNILDGFNKNQNIINLAFNRGFTSGYFDGNGNIISNVSSHIGIKIGSITKVNTKKSYKEVFFSSNKELSPKSTFKTFINGNENAVITAYDLKKLDNNSYVLTTTANVSAGEEIRLIIDYSLENELLSFKKKIDVNIKLLLAPLECICAEIMLFGRKFYIYGDRLEYAKTSPLTEEEIKENFTKSEFFNAEITPVYFGENRLFITKKQLNDFRRKVFDFVYDSLTSSYHKKVVVDKKIVSHYCNDKNLVKPLKDFVIIKKNNLTNISQKTVIYSPEFYQLSDVESLKNKCENAGKNLVLDLPNFATNDDIKHLKNIVETLKIPIVVNNYYALNFNTQKVVGAFMNIYNDLTKNLLGGEFLTAEVDYGSKINLPFMTLKACPYKNHLHAKCDNCPHKDGYYLKMESGKVLKIERKKLSSCTFYLTE